MRPRKSLFAVVGLGALAILAAGCIPPAPDGDSTVFDQVTLGPPASSATATIETPGTPDWAPCGATDPAHADFVYAWVMIHVGADWLVQIGPMVNRGGTHVAWYAWGPGVEHYGEGPALDPGTMHSYSIARANGGWSLTFDGQPMAYETVGADIGDVQAALEAHGNSCGMPAIPDIQIALGSPTG